MRARDRIDLRTDPPPDLVIEVDITHTSLWKLPVFARFGVPEVWLLEGGRYVQGARSHVLPGVTADAVSRLLEEGKEEGISGIQWVRRVRAWTQRLEEQTAS